MNWTDNYKWMYRVHLIGGGIVWAPHMERRTQHTYRLKSARGDYSIIKTSKKLWELKRRFTTIGRLTFNPLRVYAALYRINRNGGASI